MLSRMILAAALLAATACTNIGIGKIAPGAPSRFRSGGQFGTQQMGGGWYRMGPLGGAAQSVGGGRYGAVAGGRIGLGTFHVGDTDLQGGGGDARVMVLAEVLPFLGVGLSAGMSFESAKNDTVELSHRGYPIGLHLVSTPTKPFLIRLSGIAESGRTEMGGFTAEGMQYGGEVGLGILVGFRGWHFIILGDWKHLQGHELPAAVGSETVSSDMFLLDGTVAF